MSTTVTMEQACSLIMQRYLGLHRAREAGSKWTASEFEAQVSTDGFMDELADKLHGVRFHDVGLCAAEISRAERLAWMVVQPRSTSACPVTHDMAALVREAGSEPPDDTALALLSLIIYSRQSDSHDRRLILVTAMLLSVLIAGRLHNEWKSLHARLLEDCGEVTLATDTDDPIESLVLEVFSDRDLAIMHRQADTAKSVIDSLHRALKELTSKGPRRGDA